MDQRQFTSLVMNDYAVEPPDFAHLAEEVRRIRRSMPRGNHVFLAPMPKSGSTFLSVAAREVTGYEWFPMNFAYWQTEHDFYLPALLRALGRNTVTQQHTKASDTNVELMRIFGIRPVVLARNLFDVVVSYRDHMHKYRVRVPPAYVNERFFDLSQKKQYDLIIDMFMPWYVSFYVSWYDLTLADNVDLLWMSYDDILDDPAAAVRKVLLFHNLPAEKEKVVGAIAGLEKWRVGFNRGVAGRGMEELTEEQRGRIVRLTRNYDWVDFTSVGIGKQNDEAARFTSFHRYRQEGTNRHAKGDLAGACEAYRLALKEAPGNAPLHVSLGNALAGSGDLRGARDAYFNALRADPEYAPAWSGVALLAECSGDGETAREARARAGALSVPVEGDATPVVR